MRPFVAFRCAALTLALVGCGGSGGTEEPTAAGPDPGVTAAPSAAPSVAGVGVAPCDLLTAEDVAAATGLAVEEVLDEPPISCVFDLGTEAGVDIFINVEDGGGSMIAPAAVFDAYMALVSAGDAEQIGDLGAAAVYAPGYRGLAVDAGGGRFIAVGVSGGFGQLAEPRDALVSLARAALERL